MINRQHAETVVTELIGLTCQRVVSVGDVVLLLEIDHRWFRVFVDAALLFLEEVS